jgi:hypothetical protein
VLGALRQRPSLEVVHLPPPPSSTVSVFGFSLFSFLSLLSCLLWVLKIVFLGYFKKKKKNKKETVLASVE